MFTGALPNVLVGTQARPLARLTIGITNANGEHAELKFVRDDATNELVAQTPPPTEQELNEQYLAVSGWEKHTDFNEPPYTRWEDPCTGGNYFLANALVIQEARDMDENANFINAETPLGDETFGGE